MSTYKAYEAIEEMTNEVYRLKASREYNIGRRVVEMKKYFPFHMLKYVRMIYHRKQMKKMDDELSRDVVIGNYYASPDPVTDKKGVVYTCITDGYDDPIEPVLVDPNLDYLMFTDKTNVESGSIWQLKAISQELSAHEGNYANRYYKFNPHVLFAQDYDYAVYIDGSVQIVSDVTGLFRIAHESPTGIAIHKHYARNCAYKEAEWCQIHNKGNVEKIEVQVQRYKDEGFPANFGLCECPVIVVDLKSENAKKIMDAWWHEFAVVSELSGRDQISLPYIIWKLGFTMGDIGNLGDTIYKNPKFMKITYHNK